MVLCVATIFAYEELSICRWKGNAHAAFSIIHDDFGDASYTPEIIKAGNMAAERDIKIASGAVVYHMVQGGEERWEQMNSFIAQGHEIVNHSWKHDNPQDAAWDDRRDMLATRDTLEVHLDDSLWQKKITFFVFPEDKGTRAQLDTLKKHSYIGARWREGYGGSRINSDLTNFNPFQSDFYGYISEEFIDSIKTPEKIAEALKNAAIQQDTVDTVAIVDSITKAMKWLMTYPDQPYPPFDNFTTPISKVEQRHIEMALKDSGWGLMEMHSLAPSQIYPSKNACWWSPMSYTKYEALLDRLVELRNDNAPDSIWVDVPSTVASYIELRKKCLAKYSESLGNTEGFPFKATIGFDCGDIDSIYLTELTIKVPTFGRKLLFYQNDKPIQPYAFNLPKNATNNISDTIYLDVNPALGAVSITEDGMAINHVSKTVQKNLQIKSNVNHISCSFPQGAYEIQLFNLHGQAISKKIQGVSPKAHSLDMGTNIARGNYIAVGNIEGKSFVKKVLHR